MSSPASPETIALRLGLDVQELDQSCDEALFPSLANFVHPWREVFAYRLLAPIDLDDIDSENVGRSEQTKRLASLRKWKVKCGAKATYGVLITSLLKNGDVQNAENICREIIRSLKDSSECHSEECTYSLKSTDSSLESKKKMQVSERISKLEEWFMNLKSKLLSEMKANQTISPQTILESLAMLPLSLQAEYKKYVMENLSTLAAASSVSMMFVHLSLNFTFIDHGLLEHLIKMFGSSQLKQDMSTYAEEIQVFLDETTVSQLGEHWPGRQELPPHFDKLLMMIDKDPGKCSLHMVNDLRKRFCSEVHLSEIVFVLIGIGKANSFMVVLMVPSVLGPQLMGSVGGVEDSFYQRESIISISLNQQQLYLSVTLRERKRKLEQRLLKLCIDNTGDVQKFRYILSQPGVDPNIYYQNGWTPLCCVSYNGLTEIAEVLLDYGATVDLPIQNTFANSPLILASQEGRVATCALLVERGATVDYQNKEEATALYKASQFGWKEVAELLLDRGASVDKPNMDGGFTALRVASVRGHTAVAGVLIARGAAVDYQDKYGTTPLYVASLKDHKEVAQLLLHSGAQPDTPDKESSTPLTVASEKGHEEVCQLLIQHGAEVNHQHKDGVSPLHFASIYGHPSIVELLIKSGAQLDIQTKDGWTALAWATYRGHKQIVHILLNAGANPDIQDQKGMTVLMLATQCGHKDIIKALVERNANPNITDKTSGWTALHMASKEGHVEISRMLIEGRADVDIKDKSGLTAHDIASINSYPAVCQLLEQYGHTLSHPALVPPQLQSTHHRDPVTSLQTFRDILEHGSKLPDSPLKHQASHETPLEYDTM